MAKMMSHNHQNFAQWRFAFEPNDSFFTKPEVVSALASTLVPAGLVSIFMLL